MWDDVMWCDVLDVMWCDSCCDSSDSSKSSHSSDSSDSSESSESSEFSESSESSESSKASASVDRLSSYFPSGIIIYGISRDGSKNFDIRTCEHMILG